MFVGVIMDVVDRLKLVIESQGLSKQDFAESIGIKPAFLSNILSRVCGLPEKRASIICDKYGISKSWLLYGIGEMSNIQEENNATLKETKKKLDIIFTLDPDKKEDAPRFISTVASLIEVNPVLYGALSQYKGGNSTLKEAFSDGVFDLLQRSPSDVEALLSGTYCSGPFNESIPNNVNHKKDVIDEKDSESGVTLNNQLPEKQKKAPRKKK